MNTDPTVFYSLMRLGCLTSITHTDVKEFNPKAKILATKAGSADPRRLAGKKPLRISGGTWAEGFGYTRPYNESIFKTSIPNKMADFCKLASYPQAPHTHDYFVNEMKSMFGVSFIGLDEKIEPALVEAWDYFKEKSKELGEE